MIFPAPSDTIPTALSPIFPLFVITPFSVVSSPVPARSFVFPYNPIELSPATVTVPLLVISKTLSAVVNVPFEILASVP